MQRNLVYALFIVIGMSVISCNDDEVSDAELALISLLFENNFDEVLYDHISLKIYDVDSTEIFSFDSLSSIPTSLEVIPGKYFVVIESNEIITQVLGVRINSRSEITVTTSSTQFTIALHPQPIPFFWEIKANQGGSEDGDDLIFDIILKDTNGETKASEINQTLTVSLIYGGTSGAADFTTALPAKASIAKGDTSTTIKLVVFDDVVLEGDETLIVTLSNPSHGSVIEESSEITLNIDENEVLVYCNSTNSNTSDEWIERVILGSIDNPSGSNTYTDYTHLSTDLVRSNSHTITLDLGLCCLGLWTERFRVWIDYNQDGDFFDAGEEILSATSTPGDLGAPINVNFTVPATAKLGDTRMRVSQRWSSFPGPCDTFTFGEVEDYSVNILNSVGIKGNDEEHSRVSKTTNSKVEEFSADQLKYIEANSHSKISKRINE